MSIDNNARVGYLEKDLDLIQKRAKFLVFDPPKLGNDGEELCL